MIHDVFFVAAGPSGSLALIFAPAGLLPMVFGILSLSVCTRARRDAKAGVRPGSDRNGR